MTLMPPPDARPIDRAGKLLIGPLLGVGGMAEVYRGWYTGQEGFTRDVAVKRVLASYSADPAFMAMFKNEARLASLLHHPNIVSVFDLDVDREGRWYQVLELVDGHGLDALAEIGPLPIDITLYVIEKVLRGLDCAHTAVNTATGRRLGIVHRDCTPSNVLIDLKGHVRVSDFGVAKAVLATGATQSGSAKGKPAYMSPEQLSGVADLDGRSDLFAVGVMLWELLAGERLFTGATIPEIISKVLDYSRGHAEISPIVSINPAVPHEVALLVGELLAADRDRRPKSAEAALERLVPCVFPTATDLLARLVAERFPRRPIGPGVQAVVLGLPNRAGTPARHFSALTPTGLGQIAQAATGFPVGALREARQTRRRWPLAVGGIGLVAAGVIAGVMLVREDDRHAGANPNPSVAVESVASPVETVAAPDASGVTASSAPDAGTVSDGLVDAGASPSVRRRSSTDTKRARIHEVNLEESSRR